MVALQRLRVDQALLFLRYDSTVVTITAIPDTNFVTQEIVVPPRAASGNAPLRAGDERINSEDVDYVSGGENPIAHGP